MKRIWAFISPAFCLWRVHISAKLKAFFHNKSEQKQETEQPNKEPSIKSKTSWEPKENHHTVQTFIEVVNDDVVERFLDKNKLPKNNLTDTDKNAIWHFSKRIDLVITKADKGGATVILDVKDYIAKAIFYQKLNEDPTAKHSEILRRAVESFRKQELLSNSTASKLTVHEVRTPHFHTFPKVHKPNVPETPVVSSVECHTSKISKLVDHFLQPHAKSLPSYIKDTSDFINKINETKDINKDTILVTLDVKSIFQYQYSYQYLYQYSLSWRDRSSKKHTLNSVSQKPISTKVIIRFMFLILTLNNFV